MKELSAATLLRCAKEANKLQVTLTGDSEIAVPTAVCSLLCELAAVFAACQEPAVTAKQVLETRSPRELKTFWETYQAQYLTTEEQGTNDFFEEEAAACSY